MRRSAALARVVIYHVFGWAWLTILFPAMGLMFALAGSLMARSLDRSGPATVRRRLRRLLLPVWAFGAISVALMPATGWRTAPTAALGWGELLWWVLPARTPPVGNQPWAWAHNAVLWYIVTYLWFVLLSPALLRMFRRWPWRSLTVALALPVAVQVDLVSVGGYLHEQAANLTAYAACWLLGFAHHDGLLHKAPARCYAWAVATLAATGAGWVIIAGLTGDTFDLNRIPGGNTLWSAAFVAAVLRFQPQIDWLTRLRPINRTVGLLNARAVSIYLWHMPAGALAATLLTTLAVPGGPAGVAVRLASVCLLTAGAVALFGWIEDIAARRPPTLIPRRRTARSSTPTPSSNTPRPPRWGWDVVTATTAPAVALALTVVMLNHRPSGMHGVAQRPRGKRMLLRWRTGVPGSPGREREELRGLRAQDWSRLAGRAGRLAVVECRRPAWVTAATSAHAPYRIGRRSPAPTSGQQARDHT